MLATNAISILTAPSNSTKVSQNHQAWQTTATATAAPGRDRRLANPKTIMHPVGRTYLDLLAPQAAEPYARGNDLGSFEYLCAG